MNLPNNEIFQFVYWEMSQNKRLFFGVANYLNELAIMSPMFDKHNSMSGIPTIA